MATTTHGYPYGVLTDNTIDLLSEGDLAQMIDDRHGLSPSGDSQYSVVLAPLTSGTAAPDLRLPTNASTEILTSTFTLTRQQHVIVGATCRFFADNGPLSGMVGLVIEVDGAVPQLGFAGPKYIPRWNDVQSGSGESIPGNDHFLVIQNFSVMLDPGTHTVKLIGDRDGTGTVNAYTQTSFRSRAYRPIKLVIIV